MKKRWTELLPKARNDSHDQESMLAIYQEKTMAIKNKIKSALIYPVAVMVVAFVVLSVKIGRAHV